jgi:hypothetical protein
MDSQPVAKLGRSEKKKKCQEFRKEIKVTDEFSLVYKTK